VAILNKGELVSQGSIETLLAGSEGPVFTLSVVGATEQVLEQVRQQPWVTNLQVSPANDDKVNWTVAVSDIAMAEAQLLRLVLAEPQARVLDFRRRRYELEEVFMQIVEGDHDR
jgi:hypothetical protein